MSHPSGKVIYKIRLYPETSAALSQLAVDLGYVVNTPGMFYGTPSNSQLLDAIGAAYLRDPQSFALALRGLLAVDDG